MKKYSCLLFLIIVSFFAMAQPASKTEPAGSKYPDGYTKTTSASTDQSLNKVVNIEIKDDAGVLKNRTTWKKDLANNWTREQQYYKPSGKPGRKEVLRIDANGKLIDLDCGDKHIYYRNLPEGELKKDRDTKWKGDEQILKIIEDDFKKQIKDIEENIIPSLEAPKSACAEPGSSCQPQFVAFAGPSILFGQNGQEYETFFGGHASFIYNLSSHVGLGIDASLHSKKIGPENLTRIFITATGQYNFGDMADCNRTFIPDIHLLAGLASEKYGTSNGSGFVFGAGAGVDIRLTNTIAIRTQADFLGIKFKNTDELNKNLRFSMGVVLFVLNIKRQMYGGASLINLNEQ